jgi:hypothetical protein
MKLYWVLQQRVHCQECGGQGIIWLDIDGEAEPDACSCETLAYVALTQVSEDYRRLREWYCESRGVLLEDFDLHMSDELQA